MVRMIATFIFAKLGSRQRFIYELRRRLRILPSEIASRAMIDFQ